jgi:hypothetical protein
MTVDGNAIFILCMNFLPSPPYVGIITRMQFFLTNLFLVDGHWVGRRVDMVHRKSSWPL